MVLNPLTTQLLKSHIGQQDNYYMLRMGWGVTLFIIVTSLFINVFVIRLIYVLVQSVGNCDLHICCMETTYCVACSLFLVKEITMMISFMLKMWFIVTSAPRRLFLQKRVLRSAEAKYVFTTPYHNMIFATYFIDIWKHLQADFITNMEPVNLYGFAYMARAELGYKR